MADKIGPNFGRELIAAGLNNLPLLWQPDGTIVGRDKLTPEQNTALDAVIAAHDPTKAAIVPITKVQAMIALRRSGKLNAVKTAVGQDPETQLWFDHADMWHRDNPRIKALAPAIGLTEADLDNLFRTAKTITE